MVGVTPIFQDRAFDPETLEALVQSYERALGILNQTGELRQVSEAMSEILAQRIVELGQRGERNVTRLTIEAVKFMRAHRL